jgi:hypothetical protein
MKPGLEKDLVGIDVADARDYVLIQEEALKSAAAPRQTRPKRIKIQPQGFRAEAAKLAFAFKLRCLKAQDKPKLADVAEAKLRR